MIRRELPRTRSAGRGCESPRRIGRTRILLFAATPTAVLTPPRLLRRCADGHPPLDRPGDIPDNRPGDVPDEAQQLATDRRDHLVVVLPRRGQHSIPVVQALLGAPGDLGDRRVEACLAGAQGAADGRTEAIRPRGFDQDASQVGVPRLRDAARPAPRPGRAFAGDQPRRVEPALNVVARVDPRFSGRDRPVSLTRLGAWSFCGPSTARALPVSRLLTELRLSSAEALAFEEKDLGMVGQAVDQCDGAGGVGEDGVPSLEGQVGGDQQGAVLVASADELEDQVGGASIVAEVADFVD